MLDFKISLLTLNFENAFGHEHRLQPIALRAATVLAERLGVHYRAAGRSPHSLDLDAIGAPPLSLDLNRTSDEQAARQIAGVWLKALAPHLEA
jgi:hypothetical protein